MRAIMVMYDSLNRRLLPNYGCDWTSTPNFERLARHTVTFENCYAGSMPCMPARRELHTGRHNFLHRSWGPLEPFDDSMPQMLGDAGFHTHLTTDHLHYWEDGGATYHGRYSTFELLRGQEGDPWKGQVEDPDIPESLRQVRHHAWRQDWVNRRHMKTEADHPQTRTFDAGLEFLETNAHADGWFLQIETFDPHEPFFSHQRYKDLYPHAYDGPHFDWPDYKRVTETPEQVEHARSEYAALLSMCDHSLGRVLDAMDTHGMWDDTMLIVCTDHGFLLGEHGWWGKWVQPWYDETIHTPLFVWDPREGVRGRRRDSLVQTVDIAPTLLEYFGVDRTPDMQGRPLGPVIAEDEPQRAAGLFGAFGGHVSVTDGRYVYMRACADQGNGPLFEHTLMPTHMRGLFTTEELAGAELAEPFGFTKGLRTLRTRGTAMLSPLSFGTLLYDLQTDPDQQNPLRDDALELRMAGLLVDLMRDSEAPPSQFERLGLPAQGPVEREHLLVERQWGQVVASSKPLPDLSDLPRGDISVYSSINELMGHAAASEVLSEHAPRLAGNQAVLRVVGPMTPVHVASVSPDAIDPGSLRRIAEELAMIDA